MSRIPLNLSDGDGLHFDENGDVVLLVRGNVLERWTKVTGAEAGNQAITGDLAVSGNVNVVGDVAADDIAAVDDITAGGDVVATGNVQAAAVIASGAVQGAGFITGGSVSAQNLKTGSVTLTAAQVKALADTPIEVAAAPGTGWAHVFVEALLELDAGTEVFTETADNLEFTYENEAGAKASAVIETTGFIDQLTNQTIRATPVAAVVRARSAIENKALVLVNPNDNIAGNASNDAELRVTVVYRTIALDAG